MANTRFKGGTSSERLNYTSVSDADMIQLRHKPGTEEDTDKGISKASLVSCPFGVSETIAATAAKTAALTDSNPDFSLVSGREVVVYFSTANSANTPTLNFAGSGAAPIYYPDGSAVGSWAAGTWMHLKYFSATVGGVLLQRWILLSPGKVVDEVALNNMHSVTSNAVAEAINNSIINIAGTFTVNLSDNGYDNVTVNFPNSLPNSNYCLSLQAISTGSILFTVMERYVDRAVVNVRNLNNASLTVNCNWFLICKK